MNLLTIIIAVTMLIFIALGVKQGLIDGLAHIVSYTFAILVIFIIVKGVGNFIQKSYVNLLIAFILLALIRIIYHILKVIIDSLQIASELPVVNWINHLLGIVIGIARCCIIWWILFIVIGYYKFGPINDWIIDQVSQNIYLSVIYKTNLLVPLLLLIQ